MERIASRQNPLVRRFRELARGAAADGATLLDGVHLLQEALRSQAPIELVAISDQASSGETFALAEEAGRAGARLVQVPDQVLAAMSPVRHPTGIVAIAHCPPAALGACLDARPAGRPDQAPLLLLLAGVQDAGNVGAIIRSGEACGATAVVCATGTADPFGWKALRGAMGSSFRMPIAVAQPLDVVTRELQARGITLAAMVPHDGTPPGACDLRGPVALLLGAEGAGLTPDLIRAAGLRISIPMRPPVESLNVAIAAALILFEALRQREAH